MTKFTTSALLLVSSLRIVLAANCSLPPVYNDIHKRVVHGSDTFQYGSFIGVGTPSQNQSIFVSLRLNETSFASSNFCQHSNLTDCQISTGGSVDYNQSTTYVARLFRCGITIAKCSPDGGRVRRSTRKTSLMLSPKAPMASTTSTSSPTTSNLTQLP